MNTNNYFYSAKNNSFYPLALKADYLAAGEWDETAIAVSDEVFKTFSIDAPPAGKMRQPGKNGLPEWANIPPPPPPPPPTAEDITQLKAEITESINFWRDQQEDGRTIFTLDGHKWDCSKASQDRLAPVTAIARAGGLPSGFFWTDAENNDIPMTAEKLFALEQGMVVAMVKQGFKIHERQRQMKKEIADISDYQQLKAYVIGWEKQPENSTAQPAADNSTGDENHVA